MNSTTLSRGRRLSSSSNTSQTSHLTPPCLNLQQFKPISTPSGSTLSGSTTWSLSSISHHSLSCSPTSNCSSMPRVTPPYPSPRWWPSTGSSSSSSCQDSLRCLSTSLFMKPRKWSLPRTNGSYQSSCIILGKSSCLSLTSLSKFYPSRTIRSLRPFIAP